MSPLQDRLRHPRPPAGTTSRQQKRAVDGAGAAGNSTPYSRIGKRHQLASHQSQKAPTAAPAAIAMTPLSVSPRPAPSWALRSGTISGLAISGQPEIPAYDQRPIPGGKVVIEAKRYKNTVGASAVRDLFGTVHNEGASNGIPVTTSGYGKAAFQFANNKPLELIDGSGLLYLLRTCGPRCDNQGAG